MAGRRRLVRRADFGEFNTQKLCASYRKNGLAGRGAKIARQAPIKTLTFSPRPLELLGMEYGMFADRSDTTHRYASIDEFIDNATPEELQAELAKLTARKAAQAGSHFVTTTVKYYSSVVPRGGGRMWTGSLLGARSFYI
jgi:hypothetical protein